MKAKKAIKRLHRAETLLGIVIDQYEAGKGKIHELIDAARSSVAGATKAIAALPAKKQPGKASQNGERRLSKAGRKRLSIAAKKRWAEAKSKGESTLGKPSRKIA